MRDEKSEGSDSDQLRGEQSAPRPGAIPGQKSDPRLPVEATLLASLPKEDFGYSFPIMGGGVERFLEFGPSKLAASLLNAGDLPLTRARSVLFVMLLERGCDFSADDTPDLPPNDTGKRDNGWRQPLLKANPEDSEAYVPMEYNEYLQKISKVGEWGDHVMLQDAADSYGVKIFVITSFKDTCYIEILPNDEKTKRESPPGEFSRKKKKWWQFRHTH